MYYYVFQEEIETLNDKGRKALIKAFPRKTGEPHVVIEGTSYPTPSIAEMMDFLRNTTGKEPMIPYMHKDDFKTMSDELWKSCKEILEK